MGFCLFVFLIQMVSLIKMVSVSDPALRKGCRFPVGKHYMQMSCGC